MQQTKSLMIIVAVMLMPISTAAIAHGGHFRGHGGYYGFGFYPGFPWPFYFPYYPPYYPYPPAAAPPQVYIERNGAQPAPVRPPNYWYYCRNPDGYYPYVKECPGGWLQVAPQPPVR